LRHTRLFPNKVGMLRTDNAMRKRYSLFAWEDRRTLHLSAVRKLDVQQPENSLICIHFDDRRSVDDHFVVHRSPFVKLNMLCVQLARRHAENFNVSFLVAHYVHCKPAQMPFSTRPTATDDPVAWCFSCQPVSPDPHGDEEEGVEGCCPLYVLYKHACSDSFARWRHIRCGHR